MDRAALERHIRDTPVNGTPAAMRAAFLKLAHPGGLPDLPPVSMVGGCAGRWFGTATGTPILWLHGGGYVFGGSDSHARPAQVLSDLIQRPVFVPDYPLAPEHKWPAQRDAARGVLDALGACDVVGDSAGGHLALTTALHHTGAIRRMALMSPNTDRSGRSTTRKRNTPHDLMNDDAQDRRLGDMALGAYGDTTPDASPLLGDLTALPPFFITATTTEVLLDDSLLLALGAPRAGVAVSLDVMPGLFHMWHLWPDLLPQARTTLSRVARYLA